MSPVGHTLTGLAIGYAIAPADMPISRRVTWLGVTALCANAPDLPLPYWGHDRYDISHSIFSTSTAVTCCIILATFYSIHFRQIDRRLIICCAVAWFSHLLLDTFYNHGNGLAVFWPISETRVALPIPWFNTLNLDNFLGIHNLRVFAMEGVFYGAILCVVAAAKKSISNQQAHATGSPDR